MAQTINFSELQNLASITSDDKLLVRLNNGLSGPAAFGRINFGILKNTITTNTTSLLGSLAYISPTGTKNSTTFLNGSDAYVTIKEFTLGKISHNLVIGQNTITMGDLGTGIAINKIIKPSTITPDYIEFVTVGTIDLYSKSTDLNNFYLNDGTTVSNPTVLTGQVIYITASSVRTLTLEVPVYTKPTIAPYDRRILDTPLYPIDSSVLSTTNAHFNLGPNSVPTFSGIRATGISGLQIYTGTATTPVIRFNTVGFTGLNNITSISNGSSPQELRIYEKLGITTVRNVSTYWDNYLSITNNGINATTNQPLSSGGTPLIYINGLQVGVGDNRNITSNISIGTDSLQGYANTGIQNTCVGGSNLLYTDTKITDVTLLNGGSGYTPGTYTDIKAILSGGVYPATNYPSIDYDVSAAGSVTAVRISPLNTGGRGFLYKNLTVMTISSIPGSSSSGFSFKGKLFTAPEGNSAFGYSCMRDLTYGYKNVGVGTFSQTYIKTGYENVGIGHESQLFITTGNANVAVGARACRGVYNETGGGGNTGIGYESQYGITSGNGNASLGYWALRSITNGSDNVAVGNKSLVNNSTANNNCALGFGSLYWLNYGANNVALGSNAGTDYQNGNLSGNLINCSNSILLGNDTKPLYNTSTNSIVIGSSAIGIGDNSAVIGNPNTNRFQYWGLRSTPSQSELISSAATIVINNEISRVNGNVAIRRITPPVSLFSTGGQITLLPVLGSTWSTATSAMPNDNIALGTTAIVGKALIMTYDAATNLWYPSY